MISSNAILLAAVRANLGPHPGPEFCSALAALQLPALTHDQADILTQGDFTEIAVLLSQHPELQVVEDFLGQYVW